MNLCPYCPAQFADIADLGTHIRDVHMASAPPTPPAGGGGGTPPTTTPERPRKMPLIWYRRKLAEQMIERLQDEGRTVDAQEAHHETIPANQVVEVEAINGDDNNVMVTVSMGKEPAPPEPAPTPTPDPAEQLETAQPTETKDNAVKRFLRWTDS